jgi:hypothetical protein
METKIILVAVLLIAILAGVVVTQEKKIARLHTERDQALAFANTEKSKTVFYINRLGRETAKTELLDLSLHNAKELVNSDRMKFLKQFEGVNKRLNNLDEVSQAQLLVNKDWKLPLRDSVVHAPDRKVIAVKTFAYKDSLTTITGTISSNEVQPHIEIIVPLQGTIYWQRKKILGLRIGRKKWFSEITSSNPIVKIKSQEIIRISKR